jgi:Arc/MetJ-type ribon-helix-helix transcriptional regulator
MAKAPKAYTLNEEQMEVLQGLVDAGEFDNVEEAVDASIDALLDLDEEDMEEMLPMMEQMAAELRSRGEDTKEIDAQIAEIKKAIAANDA